MKSSSVRLGPSFPGRIALQPTLFIYKTYGQKLLNKIAPISVQYEKKNIHVKTAKIFFLRKNIIENVSSSNKDNIG